MNLPLIEEAIIGWVRLTGLLKNTRIPQGMNYNECIIMLILNRRFLEDGVGMVSFKEIVAETRMLKSLANRTVDSLEKKGFVERCVGKDKRTTLVRPIPSRLDEYRAIHAHTVEMVDAIIGLIGEEDARAFVRLADKISASGMEV